jgi:NADPH:quinone reductase-like Zn-dependent oxidoreductase
VQLARRFGAGRVIGVASSEEKRALAERLGADATLAPGDELEPADVVLEMVGGDTFKASLRALRPFGRLVHFGQAGREGAPKVDPGALMRHSVGVIGFWLVHMMRRPDLMTTAMEDMFAAVQAGELEVVIGGEYPLADARRAHADLRARGTVGKLVLVP